MEHFYHTFIRIGGNHAQQLVCLLPYPHGLMWFCIHVDIVAFIIQDSKGDGSLSSRPVNGDGTSRAALLIMTASFCWPHLAAEETVGEDEVDGSEDHCDDPPGQSNR